MSRERVAPVGVGGGFPRVSGDEPPYQWARLTITEFSPRERG